MTSKCLKVSNKLRDFLNTPDGEDVSTESFLYTWIRLNDAIDIHSVLMSMMLDPGELYSADVVEKLKDLKKDIDAQRGR